MFSITNGKGFHIVFENGWGVSVQFGGGSYCDNQHDYGYSQAENIRAGSDGCKNAEVAVLDDSGSLVESPYCGDIVQPDVTPDELFFIMAWAKSQKPTNGTR